MSSFYPEYEKVAEVVEEYSDLLLRVAFTYMKNISDAEDMVQPISFYTLKIICSCYSNSYKAITIINMDYFSTLFMVSLH